LHESSLRPAAANAPPPGGIRKRSGSFNHRIPVPAGCRKCIVNLGNWYEVSPRLFKVALEKTSGRDSNGHHLCVGHFPLATLLMVASPRASRRLCSRLQLLRCPSV
jgi:hypothetical protein